MHDDQNEMGSYVKDQSSQRMGAEIEFGLFCEDYARNGNCLSNLTVAGSSINQGGVIQL
jgi:hypothetical protein